MPANSKAFRRAAAIAEHHPEELYARNKGLLKMTHQEQHEFASGSEKGLPEHKHRTHHRNVKNAHSHQRKLKNS